MDIMRTLWRAILTSPPYAALTYARPTWFPEPWPGQRVLAPVGRGVRAAVIEGPEQAAPEGVALKELLWPLDREPLLDAAWMDMARNLAARQMAPLGRILEAVLPRGLRTSQLTFALADRVGGRFPAGLPPRALGGLGEADRMALMDVWLAGNMRVRVHPAKEARERQVSLACDPPWPVRPNARKRIELLDFLLAEGPQSLEALARTLGPGAPALAQALAKAELVRVSYTVGEDDPFESEAGACAVNGGELANTGEQETALAVLREALDSSRPESVLVHGVTGSGKTHVYLELAARCLESGRSAILLAPEVALACALWRAVSARFPDAERVFYHGYQSPARREASFLRLGHGTRPALVVGTRSALFLPVRKLGMVVLDEEHDESFKQEERLSYQAKEVAHFRVGGQGGLLVLGSATPDLKTFHAAGAGRIPLVRMTRRAGGGTLPSVRVLDITNLRDPETPLADEAQERLRETLAAGEQAMILLNRRGYAPLMYCLDCGQTVRCPDCHVGLTWHKRSGRLVCHYCGHTLSWPMLCPGCGTGNFLPLGEGTERLEEQLRALVPDSGRILRLDRDSARRQERLEDILGRFAKGEAQVLVGTQMLAKGHHFPDVTLVVAVNADLGLNLPDYRAAERAFQLMVQVSGRAGRGERPGEVLIQTRNPGLPFWKFVVEGDYQGFYEREIALREKYRYPPFVKLALLRLSFPADWEEGGAAVAAFGKALREAARPLSVTALGPAPAPLARLRGRKRYHCLLKASDWPAIRALFARLHRDNPSPRHLRLDLDLDPVNML